MTSMTAQTNILEKLLKPLYLELSTLKGKPIEQQIKVVEVLSDNNSFFALPIREAIRKNLHNSLFDINISSDDIKVVRIALLITLLSDISTIPSMVVRKPYMDNFIELCNHFEVVISDVTLMYHLLIEV